MNEHGISFAELVQRTRTPEFLLPDLRAALRDEQRLGRIELRNGRYAITPQGLQQVGMPLLGVRRPRELE